jgi:hypothetical protein
MAAEPKDPFVTSEGSEVAECFEDGKLLWECLKSIDGVDSLFKALETLDASELRKVVLAARTESMRSAFGCR